MLVIRKCNNIIILNCCKKKKKIAVGTQLRKTGISRASVSSEDIIIISRLILKIQCVHFWCVISVKLKLLRICCFVMLHGIEKSSKLLESMRIYLCPISGNRYKILPMLSDFLNFY